MVMVLIVNCDLAASRFRAFGLCCEMIEFLFDYALDHLIWITVISQELADTAKLPVGLYSGAAVG